MHFERASVRTVVGALALLALVAASTSCKRSSEPSLAGNTWLSTDGILLLDIAEDGEVTWFFVAGGGSCVYITSGALEGDVLVAEGVEYPVEVKDGVLHLDDPEGLLPETFSTVDYDDVCFIELPPLDQQSDRVVQLTPGDLTTIGGLPAREVTLEVPPGAVSFGFYFFGEHVGLDAAFGRLVSPSGVNVLNTIRDLQFCTFGHCSVVVPKELSITATAGTWRATLVGNRRSHLEDIDVRGIVREGPMPALTTLVVRPVIATSLFSVAQVEEALADVVALYATHDVEMVVEPTVHLTDGRYDVLWQDFLHPDTAELMGGGDPEAVNLFFIDRILGTTGLLGIASGIPASHGVAGPFNGLLVNLDNHAFPNDDLSVDLLEETIAHEVGHILGLYHPTEAEGTVFDPIADTPQCPASTYDVNMDGVVYADECIDAGGDNLMFWTPSTSDGGAILQRDLTSGQVYVIRHSLAGQ